MTDPDGAQKVTALHSDCVACQALANDDGGDLAILILLRMLETITVSQVRGDLCLPHLKVLVDSRLEGT